MAVNEFFDNYRWGGPGGLRVPQEMGGAGFDVFKEYDATATTGTVTLTNSQSGASLFTATPTANMTLVFPACWKGRMISVMNLAAATFSITCEVSGNTTNTAVVSANTNALVVFTGSNGGMAVVVAS
jgi:hypothetical protein